MYKIKNITLFFFLLVSLYSFSQDNVNNKEQIESVIEDFKKSIIDKDLDVFLSLFVDEKKVSWVGAGSFGAQFSSPTGFINMLKYNDDKVSEDFHNVKIWNDNSIAVVTFDYGFFINDKVSNWGKESWMLVKQEEFLVFKLLINFLALS